MNIREVKKTDNFELAALLRKILIEMGVPKKGTAFEDPEIDCIYETYNSPRSKNKIDGVNIITNDFDNKESIINTIYNLGIQSVIVEGGSKTLQFFIDNNYWDCIRVFKTSKELKKGTPRPNFKIRDTDYKMIGDDKLYELFKN